MMIFSKKKNSKSTRTSGDSSLFVLAKTTTATRAVTALRDDEYSSSSLFFAHRWFMVCVYIHYIICEKKFWRSVCHAERVCFPSRAVRKFLSSLFWNFLAFVLFLPKKNFLSLKSKRVVCCYFLWSSRLFSLFQKRINQISLLLYSLVPQEYRALL